MTCADIGASSGGFTDCMLQNGASKVYAVDVGYGLLDWKLRSDPRVECLERTNARYLDHEQIQEAYIVDCVSLLLLSKAYEEFAHVIEDQSGLSLAELSFLGDTYSLDLLPQIYERLAPDAIGLTEGPMLLPLKTAALILHLDTNTHADLRQLCNTCSTCKNLSCPSRKSPLQDLPHTYGAMQIFHIK